MSETWKACECCTGDKPAHAVWELSDTSTGDVLRVKVPWEQRAHHYSWGDRPHVRWKDATGETRHGLEHARGELGLTARDSEGNVVRLRHGQFTLHGKAAGATTAPKLQELRKAMGAVLEDLRKARELKAGQRWITVHPNGPDEKGVPVLIQQEPDGSHRIVAGAGGKLTHLRLHGVKSEEEHAAAASGKAKERREKEKERKGAQTDDTAKKEKKAKDDVKAAKLLAEREFVEKVRSKVGGVSGDLDDEKIKGLSSGAQSLITTRHHMKQVREAERAVQDLSRKLVDEHVAGAIESEAVKRAVEEDPAIGEQAHEIAQLELSLKGQEDEERRADRRERQQRNVSGTSKLGERAAQAILETVEKAPSPESDLDRLGGRDDDPSRGFLRNALLPSEEVERRGAQAMQEAKVLARVAKGEQLEKPAEQQILTKALERAGVDDPADADAVREAALKEAARQARRAEIQKAKASRFKEIEGNTDEGGEAGAERMLAFSDMLGGIASAAASAKKLGLTDTERVPMQAPEIAEALDVLQFKQVLREKTREFQAINKEAEAGNYDRSRRAFELHVDPNPEKVTLSVHEEVQRELAERLLGMVSRKRSEHLTALAAGHYDALADVGLGIAGQRFIDRPTVDAIGVGNAAVLMRHAMEAQGHAPKHVLTALEAHHVESLTKLTADAIGKADGYVPGMSTAVEGVDDIEKALHALDAHESDVADAQRALGSALGRMEGTATLGQAFRKPIPTHLEVSAKSGEMQTALAWLHSVGLKPDDYGLDYKEGKIQIPRSSWDKMINTIPHEEIKRRQVANDVKAGKLDQEGYLPPGIVKRAASTFTNPTPDAPRFHEPLDLSGHDMRGALEDHVGSRMADGEQPHEVLHDLLSPVNMKAAPDPEAYTQHVRELFPLHNESGDKVKYQEHMGHFQALADRFMEKKHGTTSGSMHAQDINVDDPQTHEALFRTLAKSPHAVAAFTPAGQLTHEHARALRDHFYKRMNIDPKDRAERAGFDRELAQLGPEPDEQIGGTMSLFGHAGPSPEYQAWARKRDDLLARHPRAGLDEALKAAKGDPLKEQAAKQAAAEAKTPWERYVDTHGSLELAQKAMQDEIRGGFVKDFAEHHGKITGRGLKVGVAEVTNRERHVKATATAEEADELRKRAQETYAKLRGRTGGKFAAEGEGALREKFTTHLEQETIQAQNQLGMFGARAPAAAEAPAAREPGLGERHTLGERAEAQIASLMPTIGAQFEPTRPVGLFPGLNMDGDRVHQQRVIQMLKGNGGRLAAFLGTGSGKSLTSIGAFTQAHADGGAKHGLYLVPSAVQDQFGAEMLRYTEPGKYRWATGSGKSHDERVEMLKNPDLHMRVMTHQSYRDTAMKLMSAHHGRDEATMKADLEKATPQVRAQWMREAMDAHGIPQHFVYLDEAHMATNRGGEDPSGIHMVMQATTHPTNATHALFGTATPHKNDESEVYSMASMVDPVRYADQHQFMQAFGQDLAFNPDAIRRELSHLTYSAKIDPEGVDRTDSDNPRVEGGGGMFGGPPRKVSMGGPIKLEGEHKEMVDRVGTMYERARKSRGKGQVDVEALRELSPARFEGKPEAEHEAIARELLPSLGILKEAAMRRAVDGAPPEINQKLRQMADVVHHDMTHGEWTDRSGQTQKGKPSIIFSDRLSEARMIHEHLTGKGMRVGLYHGGLNSKEREEVRLGFQPEGGNPAKYDVVVATSAAEAGINMQRAKVIHHYDVPQTEKSHAQRSGRAYRQGQQGDVDVHNWHTDAEFEQQARRRLRRKEGLASVFQTPIGNLDETGIAMHYHQAIADKQQHREVA